MKVLVFAITLAMAIPAAAQPRVNSDSAILMDFQKRVDAYIQVRKSIESALPPLKPDAHAEAMQSHVRELTLRIRHERRRAMQGNMLAPEIEAEFARLVGFATASDRDAHMIAKSLRHAEPVELGIRVNDTYPDNIPKQSTPPRCWRISLSFPHKWNTASLVNDCFWWTRRRT
jgi:hypothetical protein